MLETIFSRGMELFALATPISLAATNILFFPIAILWLIGARWTMRRWPPVWGWPEKLFLIYLGLSLLSAFLGVDPRHSLREIKNKDFYILILIVMVALIRRKEESVRLLKLFMGAGLATALFGILQFAMGINLSERSAQAYVFHMPTFAAHWPQPILNLLTLVDSRVLGTRGHPLAYAECLLFNWAFAICFLLASRGRQALKWIVYLLIVGLALLVSQGRGPWIAAGVITAAAMLMTPWRRMLPLVALGAFFVATFAAVPTFRSRAMSILDRSHHSNIERMHMWHAGIAMWKTHPLLGVGPGNVKPLSAAFQTPDEKVWGLWGHLHSIYVNCLAERGALGLAAFLLFMGAYVVEMWGAMCRANSDPRLRAVDQATLLGMLGFFLGGITESSYNTAVVIMTFYFVLGLAASLSRHHHETAQL